MGEGGGKSAVGLQQFEFLLIGKGVLSALCPVLEMTLLFQEWMEEEIDTESCVCVCVCVCVCRWSPQR